MNPLRFKILMVGDAAVGKTSLVRRYVDEAFSESYRATLGFEIRVKTIHLGDVPIIYSIWDVAGEKAFATLWESYCAGSAGILVVCDLANRASFEHLDGWVRDIRRPCPHVPMVIVGNKADITPRAVSPGELRARCEALGGASAMPASAKTGEGVPAAFDALGRAILQEGG